MTSRLASVMTDRWPRRPKTCAEALSAPVGWEVIRLPGIDNPAPDPPADDLMALAAAVREVGMLEDEVLPEPDPASVHVLGRRGHLSVITDASRDVTGH